MKPIYQHILIAIFLSLGFVTKANAEKFQLQPVENEFMRSRPAISDATYQKVLELSKLPRDRGEWVAGCDQAQVLVKRVFQKIVKANNLKDIVPAKVPVSTVVMCRFGPLSTHTFGDGVIEVTGGTLNVVQSEDEAAFLIAHELGHKMLAHDELIAISFMPNPDDYEAVTHLEINIEPEADHAGIIMMERAGYDPRAAISLWNRLMVRTGNCMGFGSTCMFGPEGPYGERLQAMKALLAEKHFPTRPLTQAPELPEVHKECSNADTKN